MTVSGEAIVLVLGGLGTFLTLAITGYKALREGAAARQRNLMDDLENARERAEHDRLEEAKQRRYWERYAGQVRDAWRVGAEPPEASPPDWTSFEDRKASEAKK